MIDLNDIKIEIEPRCKAGNFIEELYNTVLYYNTKDIIYKVYIGSMDLSNKQLFLTFEMQYNKSKTKIIRKYVYKNSYFYKHSNNYNNIPKKYQMLAKELFILFEDIILLPEKLNNVKIKYTIYKNLYENLYNKL